MEFTQLALQSQLALQNLENSPLVSVQHLREGLNVDHAVLVRDILISASYGQTLNTAQAQRAAWLMQNSMFQQCFSTNESNMLIVDGMELSTDTFATSPMTFLVALLTQSLESLPDAVPITFFCRFRAKPGDELEGAQGMMRSLVSQLLLQNWDFDCGFIDEDFLEHIYNYEISRLCGLFRNLLTSAPDITTVFCIIDGISWFENASRRDDICMVMKNLVDLVDELRQESYVGTSVNLKILVTSPIASRSASEWCNSDFHLVMPQEAEGNGQALNVLNFTANTNRFVGPL